MIPKLFSKPITVKRLIFEYTSSHVGSADDTRDNFQIQTRFKYVGV